MLITILGLSAECHFYLYLTFLKEKEKEHGLYIVAIKDPGLDYYLCSCHTCALIFFLGRTTFRWPQKIIYKYMIKLFTFFKIY